MKYFAFTIALLLCCSSAYAQLPPQYDFSGPYSGSSYNTYQPSIPAYQTPLPYGPSSAPITAMPSGSWSTPVAPPPMTPQMQINQGQTYHPTYGW